MTLATWLVRLVLAAVFLAAAFTKIADPAAFRDAILTYHLLPPRAADFLALLLPWLELCTALALFIPKHRPAAIAWLGLMTVGFTVALAQAALRGLDIHCGCFGVTESVRGQGYLRYFARDGLLLLAIAFLAWRERSELAPRT